jgi:hypothetical protein
MTIWKKKGFVRSVAFVLATVILGVVSAPAFTGDEVEATNDICQKALVNCFESALESALKTLGASLLYAIPYCLNGYLFCEKYVANFQR